MRALLTGIAGVAVLAYTWIYVAGLASVPARSDAFSYFVYLPAAVVHHDVTLERTAIECCGGRFPGWTAIVRWPATGRWVNAHPIGVAVLALPAYAVAHGLTRWSNFPPDGFSIYYQHAAGLSGLAWLLVGLGLLGRALKRWYPNRVVLATLLTITFGTNLFHYGTYDSLYSHVFSFALICALIVVVPQWYSAPTWPRAALIGLLAGLVVLVRHPNAIYLALVPLFGVGTARSPREQLRLWRHRWRHALLMSVVAGGVVLPQLLLYRAASGQWLISSYGDLWFQFGSPRLAGVLFSVQKGLFFWSPVLLAAVAGWFLTRGAPADFRAPIAATLPLTTYIIASWWDWQYGASYGHRGFTDALGLFAIGLAAFFDRVGERPALRNATMVAVTLMVALSIAQMLQYWLGTMPMADLTWDSYKSAFLRFSR